MCSSRWPLAQEIVAEGREDSALLVVFAVVVAAGGGLIKAGIIAHRLQLCGHVEGVAGMDAVVAPALSHQDRRVRPAGDRRRPPEELPILRIVRSPYSAIQ